MKLSRMLPVKRNLAVIQRLAAVVFGVASLLGISAEAQAADPLHYFKNYFVTGDYAVAGVSLKGKGVNGIATGKITMATVPPGADIVAAYLYWGEEEKNENPATANITFDGNAIIGAVLGDGNAAACFSSGGTTNKKASARMYRADVMRYLPIDKANSIRIANGDHTVSLPDSGGNGNGNVNYAEGASLVVIYRLIDPINPAIAPLRSVVIYDGDFTMSKKSPPMAQTIGGFYQTTLLPFAKMTQVVANGNNDNTPLSVNGTTLDTTPFDTSWANPSFLFNLSANTSSLNTQVTSNSNQACLTWGAIVVSMNVQDSDRDGLLDVWETKGLHLNEGTPTTPATFGDCNSYPGEPCVNLPAMGALPNKQDIFVEIDWMTGNANHPHEHKPWLQSLRGVANVFKKHNIALHFDVGNNYQGNDFIVPTAYAQGGEVIAEETLLCPNLRTQVCQFPNLPYSALGWKVGFRAIKEGYPLLNLPAHFLHNRKDVFRYSLFSHALAIPNDPDNGTPKSVSGVADRPGADFMVSVGLWRSNYPEFDQVGDFTVQAGTLMHELGHTLGLSHGGAFRTPNCMVTYPSIMNYLYQTRGLSGFDGSRNLDFSSGLLNPIAENLLIEDPNLLGTLKYKLRYYGPLTANDPPGSAAKTHCDGTKIQAGEPQMVRLENQTSFIDWNHDNLKTSGFLQSDVNFSGKIGDGAKGTPLQVDSNDWHNLNLQQISARQNVSGLSADVGQADLGQADLGQADLGQADLGQADLGQADLGQADLGQADLGQADLGDIDFPAMVLSSVEPPPTPSADCPDCGLKATNKIDRITLSWKAPTTGEIQGYNIYRSIGGAPATLWRTVAGGGATITTDDIVDGSGTLFNTTYTYAATAVTIVEGAPIESGYSNQVSGIVKRLFIDGIVASRKYGDANPASLFTVRVGSLDPPAPSGISCSAPATNAPVGDYDVVCTGPAVLPGNPINGITYTNGKITVEQRPVTASVTIPDKFYDATTNATVQCSLNNTVFSDDVSCSATGSFPSSSAATYTVQVGNFSLGGTKSGNYKLTTTSASVSNVTIKKLPVTATVKVLDKSFDGTTSATVQCSVTPVVNTDVLSCTASAAFPAAGPASYVVPVTNIALGGASAGNYVLTSTTGSSNAKILPSFATSGISSMLRERAFHSATLLPSGKVLIVGGTALPTSATVGAEVYDPVTKTFSATATNLPNRDARNTATLLGTGKVLIVGGTQTTAALYDPATNAFTSGGTSGTINNHTATLLTSGPNSGKVLITGGKGATGNPVNTTLLYDPATNSFSAGPTMNDAREFHTATVLPSGPNAGKIVIAGGRKSVSGVLTALATAELYDPATNSFTAIPGAMTGARFGHTASVFNGKVLLAGGVGPSDLSSAELYDPSAASAPYFTPTGSLGTARTNAVAFPFNGGIMIAGGSNGNTVLSSVEVYFGTTFSSAGNLSGPRAGEAVVVLNSGAVLITGGVDTSGTPLSSAELLQ
jgi:uncharacterized protein YjbI with pentapeptide repeats